MKSRLAMIMTLIGLSGLTLALSACDKCGEFDGIRVPGQPHACRDARAQ